MAVAIEHAGAANEAFAALYRETRAPLLAFCRRLVGPDGDAEGLAQEALVRGWRTWDPESGRAFWPWAVTVARNLAIDESRKVTRRRNYASVAGLATSGSRFPDPEDEVVRAAEHEAVREAFDDLPAPYQTALHMHYVERRSYQEIADLQAVSTETVRGMLRRARQALRAAYTRLDEVSAVVAIGGVLRRARLRLDTFAARTQARLVDTGSLFVPVEAVRGAVALVLVIGGGAALVPPNHPAANTPASVAAVAAAGGHHQQRAGAAPRARDAAAADSTEGVADEAAPVVASPLPLGIGAAAVTTPEEAWFTQVAVAPGADRTMIGVGRASANCPGVDCNVLFLSEDAGATWRRLTATGFRGGLVMLPPAWPADHRIFVIGPSALQESTDGGETFVTRTPAGQSGAMSPAFSAGDPVIWIGLAPGWVYHDDTKSVSTVDLLPPPVSDAASYAFAPAWPDDNRVLVGGWGMAQDGTPVATVTTCGTGTCATPVTLAGVLSSPHVLAMPSFGRTGTAFAWAGDKLLRSTDAGASFNPLELPGPGKVSELVTTPDDTLYLALADVTNEGEQVGGLYVSSDHGSSWRRLGAKTRLGHGVSSIAARADGRLVAGVQAPAGGGLLCSADGGKSWARRCA